jgi:hypothetical protein
MKPLFLIAALTLILVSCKKPISVEKASDLLSLEMSPHSSWPTERFKSAFDIQVPPGYEGQGMLGFEGNIFNKHNTPDSTYLWYSYCGPLFCDDYRDVLTSSAQASVSVRMNYVDPPVTLSNRLEFTRNNQIEAILFHNNEPSLKAALFLYYDGSFRESLEVAGRLQHLPDIANMIRTIRPH